MHWVSKVPELLGKTPPLSTHFPTHPPCTACHKEAVPHHLPSSLLRNPLTFSLRVRHQLMSSWNTVIPSCLTFCQMQEHKANWKDHFYAKGSSKFISRPDLSAVSFPPDSSTSEVRQPLCFSLNGFISHQPGTRTTYQPSPALAVSSRKNADQLQSWAQMIPPPLTSLVIPLSIVPLNSLPQ